MQNTDHNGSAAAFGPTFFALAGFVNAATVAPKSPTPALQNVVKTAVRKSLFARFRRAPSAAPRAAAAPALTPILGALAGFVRTATGGRP